MSMHKVSRACSLVLLVGGPSGITRCPVAGLPHHVMHARGRHVSLAMAPLQHQNALLWGRLVSRYFEF